MENVIIIAILVVFITIGIKEMVKHYRGEGACCGGATSKLPRKNLKNKVICTYSFQIKGMHCINCANSVTRAINDIDGAVAKVSLRKKSVRVSCDRNIEKTVIIEAIANRGYEVMSNY